MTLQKLNIQPKVDNSAKKQMVTSNVIGTNETLLANDVNAIVSKINEVVDAYNFGAPITAFNFKENVPTYADLPTTGNVVNDGYGVIADGLVYVWNGSAFPPDGDGINLGLKPSEDSKVVEGNLLAVNGNEVNSVINSVTNPFMNITTAVNLADPKKIFLNYAIDNAGIYTIGTAFAIIIFKSDPSKKYTVSGWNTFRSHIAFYSGAFPISPINRPPNLIQAGQAFSLFGYGKVNGVISFFPVPNSTWTAILVKDQTEAMNIFEKLQIEEGDIVTDYYPYAHKIVELKPAFAKDTRLILRKTGDNILIRTSYNNTKDLVRTMSLHGNANGAANLTSSKLILKKESISAAGEIFHPMGDTIPPAFQIGASVDNAHMNVAGNHGLASITDAVSIAHGKTNSDLLSTWIDPTGWEYYLVEILNSDSLRFASKPKNIDGIEKIKQTPTSPVDHVSGAVNTGSILFTGSAYEYKPSIRDIDVKLYIDGVLITQDGDYKGNEVKVSELYLIADPTKPTLAIPYLPQNNGKMIDYKLTHIFNSDNNQTHEAVADWSSNHYTKSHLVIVPQTMYKLGNSVKCYSNNIGIKGIHNFDTGISFDSNLPAYVTVVKEDLKNQNFHYNQFSHLLFEGINPILGGGYGLLPIGQGKSELQLLNDTILEFSSARKGHPRPFTGFTENKVIRSIGYFSYWDASLNPKFSAAYSVKYGDVDFFMIQIRENIEKETLKMIGSLLNRELEILHKTTGLIIHTPDATTNEGLIVSGNVGDWAILKIL